MRLPSLQVTAASAIRSVHQPFNATAPASGKIASDPGHGLIGKLEKADPIDGEPASQHYYWIVTKDTQTYFDGNSAIGQRILKVCKIGQLCAVTVGEEKSWEHNVEHATFWITKLIGEPISE